MTHREIVDRMPLALAKRPRDHRGYPIPWFTPIINDKPDFQHVEPSKAEDAVREGRCWTCGEHLSLPCAFVVGPMCAVNRTSAEPPSHIECAVYAARACPFLARPKMARPSGGEGLVADGSMPGIGLLRNPGVALVWVTVTPSYDPHYRLFNLGDPVRVRWYAHSEKATREQVMESIDGGMPHLRGLAEQDGPEAVAELEAMVERAMALVPA